MWQIIYFEAELEANLTLPFPWQSVMTLHWYALAYSYPHDNFQWGFVCFILCLIWLTAAAINLVYRNDLRNTYFVSCSSIRCRWIVCKWHTDPLLTRDSSTSSMPGYVLLICGWIHTLLRCQRLSYLGIDPKNTCQHIHIRLIHACFQCNLSMYIKNKVTQIFHSTLGF